MSNSIRISFFIGDLLFLNLSILFSYSLVHNDFLAGQRVNLIYLFIFSNLTWFFLIIVSNPYGVTRSWGTQKTLRSQLSFLFVHLLVVAFLIFFFKKTYSVVQIGAMYLLFVPVYFGWKLLALYLITNFSEGKVKLRNMIIVGESELVREVRKYFLINKGPYRFLAAFGGKGDEVRLEEIQQFCVDQDVHEILCCVPELKPANLKDLIDFGLNQFIRVKLITSARTDLRNDFSLEKDDQMAVSNLAAVPLDESRNQAIKRFFDLIVSSLVIVFVLSWFIPLVGLLIKLDSRGPIYFRQKRGGLYNRPFECIKFRTMIVNQEADKKQATKDDPRITRLGRFLRKSSIDEFPQFFNVWTGDMSLIGPRPHPLKLNEEFSEKIEGLMSRHYVKPGITGLAQSMGYRGETKDVLDMRNRITMDRFYIENWSLLLDMKIVFRTIVSLIKGSENAY